MNYFNKYMKYKQKYVNLKIAGGAGRMTWTANRDHTSFGKGFSTSNNLTKELLEEKLNKSHTDVDVNDWIFYIQLYSIHFIDSSGDFINNINDLFNKIRDNKDRNLEKDTGFFRKIKMMGLFVYNENDLTALSTNTPIWSGILEQTPGFMDIVKYIYIKNSNISVRFECITTLHNGALYPYMNMYLAYETLWDNRSFIGSLYENDGQNVFRDEVLRYLQYRLKYITAPDLRKRQVIEDINARSTHIFIRVKNSTPSERLNNYKPNPYMQMYTILFHVILNKKDENINGPDISIEYITDIDPLYTNGCVRWPFLSIILDAANYQSIKSFPFQENNNEYKQFYIDQQHFINIFTYKIDSFIREYDYKNIEVYFMKVNKFPPLTPPPPL